MTPEKEARAALEETLRSLENTEDYIQDFLAQYDRNLDNVHEWGKAAEVLKRVERLITDNETKPGTVRGKVALRADEGGKPQFHFDAEALDYLLSL